MFQIRRSHLIFYSSFFCPFLVVGSPGGAFLSFIAYALVQYCVFPSVELSIYGLRHIEN
jgi:hypothetical protein